MDWRCHEQSGRTPVGGGGGGGGNSHSWITLRGGGTLRLGKQNGRLTASRGVNLFAIT